MTSLLDSSGLTVTTVSWQTQPSSVGKLGLCEFLAGAWGLTLVHQPARLLGSTSGSCYFVDAWELPLEARAAAKRERQDLLDFIAQDFTSPQDLPLIVTLAVVEGKMPAGRYLIFDRRET